MAVFGRLFLSSPLSLHCISDRCCCRRSALMKKCSFRGNSLISTGMASNSSLSMLKKPPVSYKVTTTEVNCETCPYWLHMLSHYLNHSCRSWRFVEMTSGSCSRQTLASSFVEVSLKTVGSLCFCFLSGRRGKNIYFVVFSLFSFSVLNVDKDTNPTVMNSLTVKLSDSAQIIMESFMRCKLGERKRWESVISALRVWF